MNSQEIISNFFKSISEERIGAVIDDIGAIDRSVFVSPAQWVTPQCINRITHLTGGIFFVAVSEERSELFGLTKMTRPDFSTHRQEATTLNMCTSVEAREGVTTGISAFDRAKTISVLGEEAPNQRKLVQPGHIFPVVAREGGVLVRSSLVEAALDIAILSGCSNAALFVDALNKNGELASTSELKAQCEEENIPYVTLSAFTKSRLKNEKLIQRVTTAKLPTRYAGELTSYMYKAKVHDGEHIALVKGDLKSANPVLTRVQAEFTFGDVFGSSTQSSRKLIENSLKAIGERGSGVFLYLRRATFGHLKAEVNALEERFSGKPTDLMREYGIGAQILRDLGVTEIELLSNSNRSLIGLQAFGINIVKQIPIGD